MTTTVQRIFNFSAGPAVLPVSGARGSAARSRRRCPASACRCSRSAIARRPSRTSSRRPRPTSARSAACRRRHKVLFLQGGASLQFSMVPMNLLTAGRTADYIVTGGWAQKAVKEAQRVGTVHIAGVDRVGELRAHPAPGRADADARRRLRALHDQQHDLRHRVEERAGGRRRAARVPTRRRTCSAGRSTCRSYGLIYAGAQKNLGPSGVTLVIIREDLLARSAKSLPTMLNYAVHAENGSMYNTPPCFGIYLMGLVVEVGARRRAG